MINFFAFFVILSKFRHSLISQGSTDALTEYSICEPSGPIFRLQIMLFSGMALRTRFRNAQQHTISEHRDNHSFKNIWQKDRSAKPFHRAFRNVYAVRGSGMATLSVFRNSP